jgi:threonine dehydrogenase-like Zn-dependent dehydrogenase
MSSLIAAKEGGAFKIIVIGAPESRLKIARELGADVTINIEEVRDPEERIRLVKEHTEGEYGVDAVFECTGVPSAVPEGISMLRRGGTYVVLGHFTDAGDTSINPFKDLNNKHITLVGVWGGDVAHFVRGRPIVESGKYPIEKFVSHKLSLDRCGDAMNAVMSRYRLDEKEVNKIVIVGSQ